MTIAAYVAGSWPALLSNISTQCRLLVLFGAVEEGPRLNSCATAYLRSSLFDYYNCPPPTFVRFHGREIPLAARKERGRQQLHCASTARDEGRIKS